MTYLEKLKLEGPERWENASDYDKERCLIGCPCSYGYEKHYACSRDDTPNRFSCKDCWNREIPEEETVLTIKKEEKPVKTINTAIWDRVDEQISRKDIEEGIIERIEHYDFDEVINDVIDEKMPEVEDRIKEIAHDAAQDAIDDIFDELFR